jgi:hypothetical protein
MDDMAIPSDVTASKPNTSETRQVSFSEKIFGNASIRTNIAHGAKFVLNSQVRILTVHVVELYYCDVGLKYSA